MNIAFLLIQNLNPNAGGVQRSTHKLAKLFKSNGHNVIVFSLSEHQKDKIDNDINIYSLSKNKKVDLYKLKKTLVHHNISYLINQSGFSLKLTRMMIKVKKEIPLKLINTLRINPLNFIDNHEVFISVFLKNKGFSFFNNIFLRMLIVKYHKIKQAYELNYIISNIDSYVLLSESFKAELYEISSKLERHNRKIHAVGNPFSISKIIHKELKKENAILFVGRLNIIQKRTDLLLQIWKELHQKLPNWEFWVVGEGHEKNNMIDFCKTNKLNRVKFFGQRDSNPFYEKAKILHMTSAFEGFGNVLVEAQSNGCVPIMFNSYTAAQDIVLDYRTGFLVKPFELNAFIDKTVELTRSHQKLNELSINGFEHSKNFSYDETYKKWKIILSSC